tara:strand:+ start:263 stop:949 length:687 start_codon:yes stop_codon:yes gene_type:complete
MINGPFKLFEPFADRLRIVIFTKEDGMMSDSNAATQLGLKDRAGLDQVHGNKTVVMKGPSDGVVQADGMFTSVPDLALIIRSADCQNFVIYDPEKNVVGLLHVGWRGLVADAIPAFFTSLKGEYGIGPEDVYVGAGPSLCQKCAEFSNPTQELPDVEERFFDGRHVDLRGVAKNSLLSLGVSEGRIEVHPDCTCCAPESYYTYRGGDEDAVKNGGVNRLCCALTKKVG